MIQEPDQHTASQQALVNALQTLSAREQIGILLSATRSLSNHDRVLVFRAAGLSALRDRFLPIALHFVLKRVLTGTIWWVLCIIAVIIVLLLLTFVEAVSPASVGPVLVAVVCFFGAFLLFSLFKFLSDIFNFFKTTRPRAERQRLVLALDSCTDTERIAALRAMSLALARGLPGESILASILTSILLILVAALLLGLTMLLSHFLTALGNFPLILLVAVVAFLLGIFAPRRIHHWLLKRGIN